MPRVNDDQELFTILIGDAISGLPVTLSFNRLLMIVFALCQELDDAGRESTIILRKAIAELDP